MCYCTYDRETGKWSSHDYDRPLFTNKRAHITNYLYFLPKDGKQGADAEKNEILEHNFVGEKDGTKPEGRWLVGTPLRDPSHAAMYVASNAQQPELIAGKKWKVWSGTRWQK